MIAATRRSLSLSSGFFAGRHAPSQACARLNSTAKGPSMAALVKQLRQDVEGVPLTMAKKALEVNKNDYAKALAWVNEQMGASVSAKVLNRVSREGVIGVLGSPSGAAMVEINSQTDFVSRNAIFRDLVGRVVLTAHVIENSAELRVKPGAVEDVDVAQLKLAPLLPSRTAYSLAAAGEPAAAPAAEADLALPSRSIEEEIAATIGKVRENIQLRRAVVAFMGDEIGSARPDGPPARVAGTYVHGNAEDRAAGMGKMGAIAVLQMQQAGVKVSSDHVELARRVAQMVVGFDPSSKQELLACSYMFSTPFLSKDSDTTLGQVLEAAGVRIEDYRRFAVGEGMEAAPKEDFAAEIQKQLNSTA